jgi:hypothetical protein
MITTEGTEWLAVVHVRETSSKLPISSEKIKFAPGNLAYKPPLRAKNLFNLRRPQSRFPPTVSDHLIPPLAFEHS